jgi:protein-S-isoprenylcysteine O-methyltransferase Ste14
MNETSNFAGHYGQWGLVVILIVVATWILYRFAAPRHWREWAGAGLVQAFIIALYAEMYGFPLTIYLLTGFLGIDIPLNAMPGHLWATLLGYGMIGGVIEMLLGGVLIVTGLLLLIGGWREVYRARVEGRMADGGLYALVRHPQYVGIVLAVFGQIVHWPTVITVALFPVIVLVYVRLAYTEERKMLERFGELYRDYQERVPMFLPRRGEWQRLVTALRDSVLPT